MPQFSEVFPNWELPIEESDSQNDDNKAFNINDEEVKAIPLSASSWINVGKSSVYVNSATSSTASPFATVYADPYEVGDKLRAYATSLTSSETCNIGFANASTNKSLASATYLSPYEACVVSGVAEKNVSVRTSTYSTPGWGNFSVDGANRWVLVR